jgi:hypothetical protein
VLKEKTSKGVLLGIPCAMAGVVLVAQPSVFFGGGGNIRCRRGAGGAAALHLLAESPPPPPGLHGFSKGATRGLEGGAVCVRQTQPAVHCCCDPSLSLPCCDPGLPLSCRRSGLGITVGICQACFNALARICVRALRWAAGGGCQLAATAPEAPRRPGACRLETRDAAPVHVGRHAQS